MADEPDGVAVPAGRSQQLPHLDLAAGAALAHAVRRHALAGDRAARVAARRALLARADREPQRPRAARGQPAADRRDLSGDQAAARAWPWLYHQGAWRRRA